MTMDFNDSIYAVDDSLVLYLIEIDSGNISIINTITDPSGIITESGQLLLSTVNGLGYQHSGKYINISTDGYFNVLIQFYDNKNLEGEPLIIVDSRTNLEAFINDRDTNDEYSATARGIRLSSGESGYMFFEAKHFKQSIMQIFESSSRYVFKSYRRI
jgi:hypothetical protein